MPWNKTGNLQGPAGGGGTSGPIQLVDADGNPLATAPGEPAASLITIQTDPDHPLAVTGASALATESTLENLRLQFVTRLPTLNATPDGALKVDAAATTQPVSLASAPLPAGAATDATLTSGSQKTTIRGAAMGVTGAADVTSTAQGPDHRALDVEVYFGGSAVNPTNIRPLTAADTISVNGTVTVDGSAHTQPISGTINVSNLPATQAVSATSLPLPTGAATETTLGTRAAASQLPSTLGAKASASSLSVVLASDQAAVPITSSTLALDATFTSGSQTTKITDGTNTAALDSSGRFQVTQPDLQVTQTISTGGGTASIACGGYGSFAVQLTGTWSGILVPEASIDGTTFYTLPLRSVTSGSTTSASFFSNGLFEAANSGFTTFRVRASSLSSGSCVVYLRATPNPGVVRVTELTTVNGTVATSTADVQGSGSTLSAVAAQYALTLAGRAGAGVVLTPASATLTLVPEYSVGSSSYFAGVWVDPATGQYSTSLVLSGSSTAVTRAFLTPTGAVTVRVRVQSYSSGSVTAVGYSTLSPLTIPRSYSSTTTNNSATTSSNTILQANTLRQRAIIVNTGNAAAYIAYGSTATTTSGGYVEQIGANGGKHVCENYNGVVSAVCASGSTTFNIVELA